MNLINLLEKFAEENSSAPAIRHPAGEISYRVLLDAVRRLAGGFRRKGIGQGSRVALMLPNVPHYQIVYLAVLRSGATVVPLSHGLSNFEMTPLLEEVEVDTIVCWAGDLTTVETAIVKLPLVSRLIVLGENLPANVISLTRLIARSQPLIEPPDLDDDDLAAIHLGSGRTGRPIGAEFTHHALAANAIAVRDTLEITTGDRILAALPLSHPAGEGLILNLAVASGCCVVMSPKLDTVDLIGDLRNGGVTILPAFPSILRTLIKKDLGEAISSTLRLTLSTGGLLDDDLLKEFERHFGGYTLECYTLRTAGPVAAINKWRTGRRVGSLGHPLPGIEMRVLDKSGKECSTGEVGELVIRGACAARGFTGRPRLSGLKMADSWIRTEDYGKMDINGFFYYWEVEEDRSVIDGTSFYIYELEQLLAFHPEINESAVVVTFDENDELILKACVVLTPGSSLTNENISAYFHKFLSPHKCPAIIRFYKDLPRDTNGNIDRVELAGVISDKSD